MTAEAPFRKQSIRAYLEKKRADSVPVTAMTAYNAPTGRLLQEAGIDWILVGDSCGNNELGYQSTLPVSMDEMIMLASAVRRGVSAGARGSKTEETYIIGDLPLGTYQESDADAVRNSIRFIKEAGMDAVKCEGGVRMASRVRAISQAGIAVMGHIGYTPQSTDMKSIVQAKDLGGFEKLLLDAEALRDAGAFSILLEAVPAAASSALTKHLGIPIYGVAGVSQVDGVLAIANDALGLFPLKAYFVRKFSDVEGATREGIKKYIKAVKGGDYPNPDETYPTNRDPVKAQEIASAIASFIESRYPKN